MRKVIVTKIQRLLDNLCHQEAKEDVEIFKRIVGSPVQVLEKKYRNDGMFYRLKKLNLKTLNFCRLIFKRIEICELFMKKTSTESW